MSGRELAPDLVWRALSPFGVEVACDLSRPLSDAQAAQFRALFAAHGLILARGQSLTMARQQEICGLLGPILERVGENGTMSNEGGGPSASELAWHSDAAYTDHPFDALSLHALDVIDDASSTRFVSAERACATLPEDLLSLLRDRRQEMIAPHYTMLAQRTCDQREPPAQKRGVMPTTFVNPHNGRECLWVSAMQTARLLDMEWEDSRQILNSVFDRLYAEDGVFEHRWRKGDVVFWDNIALQHMRGDLSGVGVRVLQRVIVGVAGVAPHVEPALM